MQRLPRHMVINTVMVMATVTAMVMEVMATAMAGNTVMAMVTANAAAERNPDQRRSCQTSRRIRNE